MEATPNRQLTEAPDKRRFSFLNAATGGAVFLEDQKYFEEQIVDGGSNRCLAGRSVLVADRAGGAAWHGQVGLRDDPLQPAASGHPRGPAGVCGQIRWLLAMAEADGQESVTFSDQVRPTSCSSQIKDSQERGKESESGARIPDRLLDWMKPGSSRELDRTRGGRKKEAKEEQCPDPCGALSRMSLPRPSIFQARL